MASGNQGDLEWAETDVPRWFQSSSIPLHEGDGRWLLNVQGREVLEEHADVAVQVGEAPDGLPLVLRVFRSVQVTPAVLSTLGVADKEALGKDVLSMVEKLEELVADERRATGIVNLDGLRGYRTSRMIGSLLGAPLFSRLLGHESPLGSVLEGVVDATSRVAATQAGVFMAEEAVRAMHGSIGHHLAIFLPIPDGRPLVAPVNLDVEGGPGPRPILYEDLSRLEGVRFLALDDDQRLAQGDLADRSQYRKALLRGRRLSWTVPWSSLAEALGDAARHLESSHRENRVHGDVKPDNLLVAEEGTRAIDPLDLPVGSISTAFTPGFAAPEQIMARPVSPATDVFALGLVLARLLKAVVYGEERTFVVPIGGTRTRRQRVLYQPEIFIDPSQGMQLGEPAIRAYSAFLRGCLAFDPDRRPASAAAFADELGDLLESHPLERHGSLSPFPGQLWSEVAIDGDTKPAWVLDERR